MIKKSHFRGGGVAVAHSHPQTERPQGKSIDLEGVSQLNCGQRSHHHVIVTRASHIDIEL